MIFPRTIAEGNAFCNRTAEREHLRYNIERIQPSLVVSPRRYGKTSLILKVIVDQKWPAAHVDLFLAVKSKQVIDRMLHSIAKLISQLMPLNQKALKKIKEFFKSFALSLAIGEVDVELKIDAVESNHAITLRKALDGLEAMLARYNKNCIIFIDELQDVVNTEFADEFEAIIRFYAQKTKHIAFVFSGSNRKLLSAIFDDRSRPLFNLCDRMHLKRISEEHHRKFINNAAKKHWDENIAVTSLDKIIQITECHSFYINYLCSHLFRANTPPDIDQVEQAWKNICANEISSVAEDLSSLTVNQKRLLIYIASHDNLQQLTSKQVLSSVDMTSRGLKQSIKNLLDRDFIEEYDNSIRIVDPLLKAVLIEYYPN